MKRVYTQKTLDKVKDYALIGLTPSQIAERLDYTGRERTDFLIDIGSDLHPLAVTYRLARSQMVVDLDSALNTIATSGDPDALKVAYQVQHQREVDELVKNLFGI